MEFFFYDPFDDISMIQSHLDQLQREMDATQQKRRQGGSNSSSATAAKKGEAAPPTTKKELKIEHSPEEEEKEAVSTWWPAVDVRETERGYELYVELPGVKKEDVKIELHKEGSGKYLIVSGKKERFVLPPPEEEKEEEKEEEEKEKEEKKEEEEKKDEKKEKEFEMWHREERVYGYFERAFSVPVETEGDEIRAKFENGVLAVSFPKHEAAKAPAKVAIQID